MLYQLSYASPDSLILLVSKTLPRPLKEGYSFKGYHTLKRSAITVAGADSGRFSHLRGLEFGDLRVDKGASDGMRDSTPPHLHTGTDSPGRCTGS